MGNAPRFPCPYCGEDLADSLNVEPGGWIRAEEDPEGKARLEIAITCDECEEECFAFIPHDGLVDSEGNGFQETQS
jgi:hypothetical protein